MTGRFWVRIPAKSIDFFFLQSPDRSLDPPTHIFSGYLCFFFSFESKIFGAHLKLSSRLRVSGAILFDPPICLNDVCRDNFAVYP
jgi:hypothetical protein